MKPVKRAVALAVHPPGNRKEVLTVLRPDDDPELPSIWGLPATTLRPEEGWEEAARRVGRDKLGVALELGETVGEDRMERSGYVLHMKELRAEILDGEAPVVPQPGGAGTQYRTWRWSAPERLEPAARRGSLCSRILLDAARGSRPGSEP